MRSKSFSCFKIRDFSLGFLLFSLWVVFVLFRFFPLFVHPWTSMGTALDSNSFEPAGFPQELGVWAGCLTALAAGLWSVGLLWSLGKFLRKWAGLFLENQVLAFCVELGLGFFFMNTLWLGLGFTRLWFEPLWLAAALIFTGLMVKDLWDVDWEKIHRPFSKGKFPVTFLPWIGIVFIYGGLLLLHGFLPETFYDSLNYFLGMPSFWLFQHGIGDYPTHLLSGYFHGGSLFYLFAYLLGGTEGAKVLSVFTLGFNAAFAFGWVREKAGDLAGTVAAVAVLTFPLIYLNSWAVRVDGLSTFTILLFVFCLEKACAGKTFRHQDRWIWTAALFAGLALSIKPTAVVGIMAAFAAVSWQGWFFPFKRKSFWLAFSGVTLFEVGPWLLKNAAFTGNPFFPYAISRMGGRQFPMTGYERLLGENRQFLPMDQGFLSFLTLPWRLTMPQAGDGQWIGPLFLAFLPALFFLRSKDSTVQFFTKTMAFCFVLGLTLSHMLRFSMPAFVLSLVLLSAVFFAQERAGWRILWASTVLACSVLFFGNYLDLSAERFGGSGIWRGLETPSQYLDRELADSYEPLVQWTGENLPPDARLLIVGDSRGVYYQRPYFAQSAFDEPFLAHAARKAGEAAGILRQLRQLGVTHLVVNLPEGLRVSKEYHQYELGAEEWKRLDAFFLSGLTPLYWKNFQGVFEIRPTLAASPQKPAPDPLSFLAPQAYDFIADIQAGNLPQAREKLAELLVFFPKDSYWLNQKALLQKAERAKAPPNGEGNKP